MCNKDVLKKRFDAAVNAPVNAVRIPEFDPFGEFEGIEAYTIEGESIHGKKTKFFAYYGAPENQNTKLPAIVLVHGGSGHAFCCWVKLWNDLGFAAIAMDTTGFMPKCKNAGCTECDNGEWERELNGVFFDENYVVAPDNDSLSSVEKDIEEQWMFHAVSAVIRSNSFLISREEIDSDKIGIAGISWGGVITSLAIGYDRRFSFAIPIYGSGYLGEGLSYIDNIFTKDSVRKLWLAEDNFDSVDIPVLWLAWNDDCAFSVQSNSLSYLHTVKNNSKSRLAFIDDMRHSHICGWNPFESYFFAGGMVGIYPEMPELDLTQNGDIVNVKIKADSCIEIISARLFYIDSPMVYEQYDKFKFGESTYMRQIWQTLDCDIKNGIISLSLPKVAAGYYVELKFKFNDKEMTVSTVYKER